LQGAGPVRRRALPSCCRSNSDPHRAYEVFPLLAEQQLTGDAIALILLVRSESEAHHDCLPVEAAERRLPPTATQESDHLVAPLDIGPAGAPNPQRSRSDAETTVWSGETSSVRRSGVDAEFARCVPGTGNRAVHPQRDGSDADLSLPGLLLPRPGTRPRSPRICVDGPQAGS
jgi:hypothetical protein